MNGLDDEYEVLTVDVYDASTEESKQKIEEYEFENHGLVIFDSRGQVTTRMDGHKWTEEQIRAALAEVMGGA